MQSRSTPPLAPLIYVINLPEATQRRAHVEQLLAGVALDYHIVAGVKGSDLSPLEIAESYDSQQNAKHYRRALSVGEIGCYLSHRECWRQLLNSQSDWALILEDDIKIHKELSDLITAIPKTAIFDLIKLSDDRNGPIEAQKKLFGSFQWVTYKRIPNCAAGYILHKNGAEKLLSRKKIFRPVDIDMQFHTELKLKVCGIKPYVIWPTPDFESHIDAQGKGGSRKTFTWPWRNWRYRLALFWLRTKPSMNIETIDP